MKRVTMFMAAAALAPAAASATGGSSISQEIDEIMAGQGVSQASEISCGAITNEQFEALGEAFMGARHPGEEEHAFMDQMMGGEGSDSLRQAHISMGQAYLDCRTGGAGFGMMGSGIMGGYTNDNAGYQTSGLGMMAAPFGGMVGYGYGASAFVWVTMALIWAVLILGIMWLVKNSNRKK